jgi:anti-anti-sigma factor
MAEIVTSTKPHQQAVLVAVTRRSLDAASAQQVAADVTAAALRRRGLPVVIDMAQVQFAPSGALGVLVQLSRTFKLESRRFALVGVTPTVLGPMRATRLHTILEIHDTVEQFLDAPAPTGPAD